MKTKLVSDDYQEVAPDGAEVRLLIRNTIGSQVHCTLGKGKIATAVVHKTVSEFWYILSGSGQLWRRKGDKVEITPLTQGTSVDIVAGTEFQYRSNTDESLSFVCTTIPPWPGEDESSDVQDGPWEAKLA